MSWDVAEMAEQLEAEERAAAGERVQPVDRVGVNVKLGHRQCRRASVTPVAPSAPRVAPGACVSSSSTSAIRTRAAPGEHGERVGRGRRAAGRAARVTNRRSTARRRVTRVTGRPSVAERRGDPSEEAAPVDPALLVPLELPGLEREEVVARRVEERLERAARLGASADEHEFTGVHGATRAPRRANRVLPDPGLAERDDQRACAAPPGSSSSACVEALSSARDPPSGGRRAAIQPAACRPPTSAVRRSDLACPARVSDVGGIAGSEAGRRRDRTPTIRRARAASGPEASTRRRRIVRPTARATDSSASCCSVVPCHPPRSPACSAIEVADPRRAARPRPRRRLRGGTRRVRPAREANRA